MTRTEETGLVKVGGESVPSIVVLARQIAEIERSKAQEQEVARARAVATAERTPRPYDAD